MRKQKIGKAIRPTARNAGTAGKNISPTWSTTMVIMAIIFKVKLLKIPKFLFSMGNPPFLNIFLENCETFYFTQRAVSKTEFRKRLVYFHKAKYNRQTVRVQLNFHNLR